MDFAISLSDNFFMSDIYDVILLLQQCYLMFAAIEDSLQVKKANEMLNSTK